MRRAELIGGALDGAIIELPEEWEELRTRLCPANQEITAGQGLTFPASIEEKYVWRGRITCTGYMAYELEVKS